MISREQSQRTTKLRDVGPSNKYWRWRKHSAGTDHDALDPDRPHKI
jgi:hypothetical protein